MSNESVYTLDTIDKLAALGDEAVTIDPSTGPEITYPCVASNAAVNQGGLTAPGIGRPWDTEKKIRLTFGETPTPAMKKAVLNALAKGCIPFYRVSWVHPFAKPQSPLGEVLKITFNNKKGTNVLTVKTDYHTANKLFNLQYSSLTSLRVRFDSDMTPYFSYF